MTNPLLNCTNSLPTFSQIKIEHIYPAIKQILEDNRNQIELLIKTASPYNWDNFIQPINELQDSLRNIWSIVEHLTNVVNTEELRQVYNQCLPLISTYQSELGHNDGLYQAYRVIANSSEYQNLDIGQQKVIQNELRDFRLSGIVLTTEKQQRYKEIQEKLMQLSTQFSENVLDASHAWKKHIMDETLLAGLPDSIRALTKQNAEHENQEGWILTLDLPCYQPILNYADNRELRHELYVAYVTRASDQGSDAGKWDNSEAMQEIIALRHELALLLDFSNYSELSLYTKMAETPQQVIDFLTDLAKQVRPLAETELSQLQTFAQEQDGIKQLEMWDFHYYAEKLRQHLYNISQEELRPYFSLENVLSGLFNIVQRLYGLSVKQHPKIDTWHNDVQFFDIYDESGQLCGQFYLDCFVRKGKRNGAWMDECLIRQRTANNLQTPVAYLVCNFTPPIGDKPSLLTHQEVITLFHEFGHGLHHILTKVDYAPIAGVNGVAWDAVELPSQFMENWAWEKSALDLFASHYKTGEPLPAQLFEKMQATKRFQAGLQTLRQLEFSLFDFSLHTEYQPQLNIQTLLNNVRQQIAVQIPPSFNRFQHSFLHIFAGGYAAGYYSYKWAEVLAADAFAKFEEQGIFNRQIGQQFLTSVLEQGGTQEPMDLFVQFRGRKPTMDALLKKIGLH
ncbi:MAG: oligopeptidase A [Thiomargarita sp.]|nr:oligopeptidase A [Thiomargarita sp.]